jgi:hypothetical protein
MRVGLAMIAAASASLICACSSTSTSTSAQPTGPASPVHSAPATPRGPLPRLPKGYVALSEPHLRIGVPRSWIRVRSHATAAAIRHIERRHPTAKSRLVSDRATRPTIGRMFAVDPASTAQVLVLVLPTSGVTVSRSALTKIYVADIKPAFAREHIRIRTHHLRKIGGRDAVRLTANYALNGITVREVVDIVIGDNAIYDLTFSGEIAAIKRVEATIAIR